MEWKYYVQNIGPFGPDEIPAEEALQEILDDLDPKWELVSTIQAQKGEVLLIFKQPK
jgi:hypothetical protein